MKTRSAFLVKLNLYFQRKIKYLNYEKKTFKIFHHRLQYYWMLRLYYCWPFSITRSVVSYQWTAQIQISVFQSLVVAYLLPVFRFE